MSRNNVSTVDNSIEITSEFGNAVLTFLMSNLKLKKMLVVNKTPHQVHILDENGQVVRTYEKGDSQIRLAVVTVQDEPLVDGTPTSRTKFGEPEGLPDFKEGTFYIVSQLVKSALPERTDLLVPAEVVRDEKGNIVGCKSLGR